VDARADDANSLRSCGDGTTAANFDRRIERHSLPVGVFRRVDLNLAGGCSLIDRDKDVRVVVRGAEHVLHQHDRPRLRGGVRRVLRAAIVAPLHPNVDHQADHPDKDDHPDGDDHQRLALRIT
jgi:hypothetical protein